MNLSGSAIEQSLGRQLDKPAERIAKLERVAEAARAVNEQCEDYSGDAGVGMSIVDRDAMTTLDDALTALETPDE